jgi:hypothetical protein
VHVRTHPPTPSEHPALLKPIFDGVVEPVEGDVALWDDWNRWMYDTWSRAKRLKEWIDPDVLVALDACWVGFDRSAMVRAAALGRIV